MVYFVADCRPHMLVTFDQRTVYIIIPMSSLVIITSPLQGYPKDSNAAVHSVDSATIYAGIHLSARSKTYVITFIS